MAELIKLQISAIFLLKKSVCWFSKWSIASIVTPLLCRINPLLSVPGIKINCGFSDKNRFDFIWFFSYFFKEKKKPFLFQHRRYSLMDKNRWSMEKLNCETQKRITSISVFFLSCKSNVIDWSTNKEILCHQKDFLSYLRPIMFYQELLSYSALAI